MTRVNLVKNPSLRSGTSGYTGVNSTLSITHDYAYYGKDALVVTKSAKNNSGVLIDPVPVVPGLSYAFSAYVRIPLTIPATEYATLMMTVQWMNSMGVITSEVQTAVLELDDDTTWYRLGGVWVAPAGSTFAGGRISQPIAGADGEEFLVDAVMIEQSEFIRAYVNTIGEAEKYAITNKAISATPQVVNGLKLGADISINDLILNTIDENNTVWVCTALENWWGQTAPELPDITRGTEDGSYDVQSRLTARSLTVRGFFIPADTGKSLSESLDRLVTAINLSRVGGWVIVNEDPTKAAWVRLASQPVIETTNARGKTTFEFTLRAGDPIKYHWDDTDPEGYTNVRFEASEQIVQAENIGTASVTGVFTITGPAGAGTRIYNSSTKELLTLRQPLRGAGVAARAQQVEAKDGLATIYTTEAHGLRPGDRISLLNMVIPFSESGQARTVTQVSEVFPFSVSFAIPTDDVTLMPTNGQIYLVNNDVLIIDTYNRSVTFNGENTGHRYRLTTLTDWIHIAPGVNTIEFYDNVTKTEVLSKRLNSNVVTLITKDAHFLIPGEQIKVSLPETKNLSRKKLKSNVVTLTTDEPHGYSVGDTVSVSSSEKSTIITKSRDSSNLVTLTTQFPNGISSGDQIVVDLPTSASPSQKSLTNNVATIDTGLAHGFSPNDSVVVTMPVNANVTEKSLTNNQATLTTSGQHGFSVGDQITVTMPSAAAITNKARSGAQAVLTAASAHGFSVGDVLLINLPVSATISGSRSISAATKLVTLNTATAHGFSVGDRITVNVGTASRTVITRTSTDTACTLTTSVNHGYAVGEEIVVSGVSSRYNGTFTITAVSANTITYANTGATEAATASSGTVQNTTATRDYNGTKVIESTPTSTSLTYRAWSAKADTTTTNLSSPTLTNQTNQAFNGTKTLVAVTPTTFAYNF